MPSVARSSPQTLSALLDRAHEFPLTLAYTDEFQHVLRSYRDRKLRRQDDLWCLHNDVRQPIWTWDLAEEASKTLSPLTRIDDTEGLKRVINANKKEATCRYFYIQNQNARSGLGCDASQLSWIFTYYQVLPALIDVTCAFRVLEEVPLESAFRSSLCLRKNQGRLSVPEIERSGFRFQHCFRLFGVEQTGGSTNLLSLDSWSVRHVAAYHSMDIKSNRSVWLVIKARRQFQEQLEQASRDYLTNHPDAWETIQGSFLANLHTHLLFFRWCSDNWTSYIDALEARMRPPEKSTRGAPLTELTGEPILAKRDSEFYKRQSTGLSEMTANQPPGTPSGFSQWASRRVRTFSRQGTINTTTTPANGSAEPDKNGPDVEKLFSFDKLQKQHRLMEQYRSAITALDRNARILQDFQAHVHQLTDSSSFKSCVDLRDYEEDVEDTLSVVRSIEEDLKTHSSRMSVLLKTLEDTIALFTGILEYNNSRITEHFSRHAKASADKMEVWTKEMHKMTQSTELQTVSMHIITGVALFFLPGTFVASIFDSNMLDFEPAPVRIMGHWKLNMGALSLFFYITLPMMVVTIALWGFLFWHVNRKRQKIQEKSVMVA